MEYSSNTILFDTNVSNFVSGKLSSNNYLVWKSQMLCMLEANNMGGIVDSKYVSPRYSSKEAVRQYDSLVRGWILGSVCEDILVNVHNLSTAKAVWEKLRSNYDQAMRLQEASASKTSTETEARDAVLAETNTIDEKGTDLNEIRVDQDKVPNESDSSTKRFTSSFDIEYFDNVHSYQTVPRLLRKFTEKGDWSSIRSILEKEKELATTSISSDGSMMLHIAVGKGQNNIVKKLCSYIDDEQVLQPRRSDGSTALHISAIVGNKDAADLLVKKNKKLLRTKNNKGKEPLHIAYEYRHLDTILCLLKAINDDAKSESYFKTLAHPGDKIVVDLLVNAISTNQYGLAIQLMQNFPKSAATSDEVLMALAKTFPSELTYVETLFYPLSFMAPYTSFSDHWSMVKLLAMRFVYRLSNRANFIWRGEEEIPWRVIFWVLYSVLALLALACFYILFPIVIICLSLYLLYPHCWKGAKTLRVPTIKHIENKKKQWDEAKYLLEKVCEEIIKLGNFNHPYYTQPILEAARQNAYKVVDEIVYRAPKAIDCTDKNGYDIIQLAIIHRSEKVYNLIYDIGERKNLYRTIIDSSRNNILHLVGRLAPLKVLSQRTGAALQLQRELQWHEEVKKLVYPTYITQENIFKETPDMVFTREHKDLVKDGEQWMKTTAESCSITAALITTIVFAAAITVPGGSNQENGTPLFNKEIAFIIFAISDAISLFASSTALLVFLSILTARFAEKDFVRSLPQRLFIGLFSLLLSTTAMMVAFSATLFLVFCDKNPWMLIPISALAFIPIASFVTLQFPLMVDLFRSTYLPIFGKPRPSDHLSKPDDIASEVELLS